MKKVILLDIDGTLLDSNDAHARSWVDAFREAEISTKFLKVRKLIGMGGDKLMPAIADISSDSRQGKSISKRRKEIFFEKYFPKVQPFPRSRELLLRLKDVGYRLISASSSEADVLERLFDRADITDLVEAGVSHKEAGESKPSPDIVTATLSEAGLTPSDALMIGDTPYDVEAARSAGVEIVTVTCGGWDWSSLQPSLATYMDPEDILEYFSDSPFAQQAPLASHSSTVIL